MLQLPVAITESDDAPFGSIGAIAGDLGMPAFKEPWQLHIAVTEEQFLREVISAVQNDTHT